MHLIESFILLSEKLLFILIPAQRVHVIFLLFHHGVGAPTSHAGVERARVGGTSGVEVGDLFHQLHHRFFDCNYGTWETPWDSWFGTFHDGTSEGDRLARARRKRILSAENRKTV